MELKIHVGVHNGKLFAVRKLEAGQKQELDMEEEKGELQMLSELDSKIRLALEEINRG